MFATKRAYFEGPRVSVRSERERSRGVWMHSARSMYCILRASSASRRATDPPFCTSRRLHYEEGRVHLVYHTVEGAEEALQHCRLVVGPACVAPGPYKHRRTKSKLQRASLNASSALHHSSYRTDTQRVHSSARADEYATLCRTAVTEQCCSARGCFVVLDQV